MGLDWDLEKREGFAALLLDSLLSDGIKEEMEEEIKETRLERGGRTGLTIKEFEGACKEGFFSYKGRGPEERGDCNLSRNS